MNSSYTPTEAFQQKLDAAVPNNGDFVLYCPTTGCEWIGETNAAHARADACPECKRHTIRIWRAR